MWRGGFPHLPGAPQCHINRPLGNPEHEFRCDAASTDVYLGQEPLIVCMFLSCLWFSQIHSRSSCSEARSCGKPDLLRINSCSCTNPICWLRCDLFVWSSILLPQSESFVNLNAFSLQNDAPPVSNKHLISIIGVYLLKLSLEIMACCDERILLVTFLSGPLRNQHPTATPSWSYLNMVWFLQNFKPSEHDFLLNTKFG